MGRLGLILGHGACVLITSTISHLTMAKAANNPDFPRIYLFRPIPAINAKLTIGQYDTESSIFDSFHFSGVSLKSDENMLPPDLRGYAPQITGVAQTNAKVTVSQNNRIIYQENVPLAHLLLLIYSIHYRGNWTSRLKKRTGKSRNGKLHLIAFLIWRVKGRFATLLQWGNRPALAAIPYNSPSSGPVNSHGVGWTMYPCMVVQY